MPARHLSLLHTLILSMLVSIVSILIPAFSYSQCNCLTGTVSDQNEKTPLSNAVISIINAKDSILTRFTRSNAKGSFRMSLPAKGEYTLMVTYPGYADFVDRFTAAPDSAIGMNEIRLIKKAELLEAVIVKQQLSAIKIKGDTIEYKADSFLVNKGANVAELLKRLPGIQVDRNGNITAQGQKVNKVLVDGEEFFSDDPAVVTQNLAADYVKDVQVYDKKSDQAEFTGVDDGERSRTINLKLKPEKKKGYFGKVNAGGGTSGKFDNSLMLNSFKGSRKLSAFGIMSNNDHNTLDWGEREKFGSSNGPEYDEENGYFMYTGNIDDEFNQEINSDEGLPTTWTAGLHYSDNFGDKQKVSGDYRFMKRNLAANSNTISRYILPDTQYFSSQSRKAFSTRIKNILSGVYDIKIDSTSSIKLKAGGSRMTANTGSFYTSRALNADSALVNDNSRTLNSNLIKDHFTINALWRKKFRKKGRTFSLNFSEETNNESLDGLLQSNTDYYSSGSVYKNELIDQKKNNNSRTSYLSSRVVYTEPLSNKVFLSFNYGLSLNENTAHRNTFNKDPAGDYKFKDSVYSNDFKYNYVTNSGGADLKINTKKVVYSIGGVSSYAVFNQRDMIKDSASKYSFLNFYPKAFIRYSMGPQKQLWFRYYGETRPPSPEQLQPVRQNTDPLNVQVGNPELRQEFN
ncbi:MAG: TonB-dependent receptor, partial [Chitinophagaceae bacterium]|nr:TonB-dependent receptor [Chitinophagaceae bacterium]